MKRLAVALLLVLSSCRLEVGKKIDIHELERTHKAHEQPLTDLWFDDTGERLVAQTRGFVRIWNTTNGALEKRFGTGYRSAGVGAGSMALSRDLARRAVYSGDNRGGTVAVFDGQGDDPSWTFKVARGVRVLGFGADGSAILFATEMTYPEKVPARIQIWRKGAAAPALDREIGRVGVAVAHDGKRIAYPSGDRAVTVVDVRAAKDERVLTVFDNVWRVRFSDDGTRLAVGHPREIVLFDTVDWREVGRAKGDGQLNVEAFPRDLIAVSPIKDIVYRFDRNGASRWRWAERDPGNSTRNRQLSAFVAMPGTDVLVYSWPAENGLLAGDPTGVTRSRTLARPKTYGGVSNLIQHMAASPKNDVVAVASGATLFLWSVDGSKDPVMLTDPDLAKNP